jgi:hypothetical protein
MMLGGLDFWFGLKPLSPVENNPLDSPTFASDHNLGQIKSVETKIKREIVPKQPVNEANLDYAS